VDRGRIGRTEAAWDRRLRAKVVEFLATDLSDYLTGALIPIDGGLVRGEGRLSHARLTGPLDGRPEQIDDAYFP